MKHNKAGKVGMSCPEAKVTFTPKYEVRRHCELFTEAHFLLDSITESFKDATDFISAEFLPAEHIQPAQNVGLEEYWIMMAAAPQ